MYLHLLLINKQNYGYEVMFDSRGTEPREKMGEIMLNMKFVHIIIPAAVVGCYAACSLLGIP